MLKLLKAAGAHRRFRKFQTTSTASRNSCGGVLYLTAQINYLFGAKGGQTSTTRKYGKQTSTMSSLSDEFQVMLPNNVKGNPRNKPNLYETELAKPLDLPGDWDVALINISYPYNWPNLDKSHKLFLLRRQLDTEDELSNFVPNAENNQQDLYDVITKVNVFIKTWEVDRVPQIPRGNYDISKILELIESISDGFHH